MGIGYIAYIDEAGDDNLRMLKPAHPNGASEWFVLAAAVIRVEHESSMDDWLTRCLMLTKSQQRRDIHFKDFPDFKRSIICSEASKLKARYFVVMSNKRNIENYHNFKLPPSKTWMYWWMARLLIERVSAFCGRWSLRHNAPNRKLEIVFSKRDGMRYSDVIDYFIKLYHQTVNDRLVLDFKIDWSVIDFVDIHALLPIRLSPTPTRY